jgi:hypothetical protein
LIEMISRRRNDPPSLGAVECREVHGTFFMRPRTADRAVSRHWFEGPVKFPSRALQPPLNSLYFRKPHHHR